MAKDDIFWIDVCYLFLFVCGLYQFGIWIGSYHWCFIIPVLIYVKIYKVQVMMDSTILFAMTVYIGLCIIYQVTMGIESPLICIIHLYTSAWGIIQLCLSLKKKHSDFLCGFVICFGIFRMVISITQSNPGPDIMETCPTYNYTVAGTISEGE